MRKFTNLAVLFACVTLAVTPIHAQFGDLLRKGKAAADKVRKVQDAFVPWTAEEEQAVGDASAAKLIHVLGYYDNPQMSHYVNLVGYALAQRATRTLEYRFGILDSEAVTAFSLPGGYVFVTRGALANMKNESELAGTLAHEIAHVDNRHLEKEVRSKKGMALAKEEGGSHVPNQGLLTDYANTFVTAALTTSYSRDKEDEADRKGTELAASVGYDGAGLKNFLATLQKASEENAEAKRSLGLWGSTHPPLKERIERLTALSEKHSGGQTIEERFAKNASFGPSPAELAKAAADKAASMKMAAPRKSSSTLPGQKPVPASTSTSTSTSTSKTKKK